MKFRLIYKGELRSGESADKRHKQDVRRVFHSQLKELWETEATLIRLKKILYFGPKFRDVLVERNDFSFVPLIHLGKHLTAKLDIIFLRYQARGHLFTRSGDLDNRIKTLFDGLRAPKEEQEIPKGDKPLRACRRTLHIKYS